MKVWLLLAALFGAAFFSGDWFHKHSSRTSSAQLDPTPYPLVNRSFVLVLTPNSWLPKTIASIAAQNYDTYQILYIDDASTDGSLEMAKELFYDHNLMHRVTLVQNAEPLGALANLYRVAHSVEDHEIVVVMEGEGWLAHEWVLARLNQYYANPAVWMTHGQYRKYPSYALGTGAEHLKTFEAALFKRIPESELRRRGAFLEGELAYMRPLLSLAQDHARHVPDILYVAVKP